MINKKYLAIGAIALFIALSLLSTNNFRAEEVVSDDLPSNRTGLAGYVKFDGIDGEATDVDHKNWINLLAFEQTFSRPGAGSSGMSRRRGDAVVEDLQLTTEYDKASPKLQEKCLKGEVIPKMELELTASYSETTTVTYTKIELKNVMITSYTLGSEDVNTLYPTGFLTVNYEEIKFTYTETDDEGKTKGNVEYTYKVEKGE
jgi:type VI secretion system secreted protein Hcp